MIKKTALRVVAALVATSLSLAAGVAAATVPASSAQIPAVEAAETVPVVVQTGVPDYFCDEGTGQHVILNPKGCYGTIYVYMDGRYIGKVNLAAYRATGPNVWDTYARLYNGLNSFCNSHSLVCAGVPLVIQLICKAVFGTRSMTYEALPALYDKPIWSEKVLA